MPLREQTPEQQKLREKLRRKKKCHKCKEPCRYIHEDKVWCRSCLDIEMYPHLAHLTQDEREKLRWEWATRERKVSFVNAENLTKIGF